VAAAGGLVAACIGGKFIDAYRRASGGGVQVEVVRTAASLGREVRRPHAFVWQDSPDSLMPRGGRYPPVGTL
jgi:hypothetical protein